MVLLLRGKERAAPRDEVVSPETPQVGTASSGAKEWPRMLVLPLLLVLVPLPAAALRGRAARDEAAAAAAFGERCLDHFTVGLPDFVLDTDASVQNGATFLSSPAAARGRDCVRACCKEPACNLALVEQSPDGGEDGVRACFLLNCLYEQAFVCKFARKAGFLNYVKRDVYDAYVSMREKGEGGKVQLAPLPAHPGLPPLSQGGGEGAEDSCGGRGQAGRNLCSSAASLLCGLSHVT